MVNTPLPFEVSLSCQYLRLRNSCIEVDPLWVLHWFVESCSSPSEAGFVGGYSRITVPSRGQDMGTTC